MLLLGGTAWAQDVVRDSVHTTPDSTAIKASSAIDMDDNDTVDDEENVIGAKPQPRKKGERKEANVLGAPVYYDVYGNVEGSGETSTTYHRPKHHYLNNLADRYCSWLFEILFALPDKMGDSRQLSFYQGRYFGRVSEIILNVWLGRHLGGEVGLRMALPKRSGKFCWTSVSMGYANFGGYSFFTAGLSLDMVGLAAASVFLFW